jgi:hypothetical protein
MLAIATKDGEVPVKTPGALARMARIELDKAQDAIRVLSSPDETAPEDDLEQGRRIVPVPGGWRIVKWTQYRDMAKSAIAKEKNAGYQAMHRSKLKESEDQESPVKAPSETAAAPFDLFWKLYPLKKGKEDAKKAFERALKKTTVEAILAAVADQIGWEDWTKEGGKFIPHPATWLNAGRWSDEKKPGADPRFVPGTTIPYFDNGGTQSEDDRKFDQMRKELGP